MTDKDMAEREAIRQELPQASLLLCLFHVLRAMSREVTTAKMALSEAQRTTALSCLQQTAYASSSEEYDRQFECLQASMPASVVRYFDANWHPCRREWVLCWQRKNVTFGERMNNRLESVNQRLKAVVRSGSSLPQFFKDLTAAIGCMRHEREQALLTATDKVCVRQYAADSVQAQFSSALTPYATSLVLQQLQLAEANQQQLPSAVTHCLLRLLCRDSWPALSSYARTPQESR